MTTVADPSDAAALQARVRGVVLRPGDPGWDAELAGFNAAVTHRPDLVVGAADAADVQSAVRHALSAGLSVGVQATGHGAAVAMSDGLLITTRRMDAVHVDPANQLATVQAGTLWRQVIDAAVPHGLAPVSGSSSGVGAVGYTLGGGLSVMGRTFGFAADYVRSLEIVTADGQLRQVDAESDPELFWGLRGGGGNLGIVTSMTIGLVPVRSVYGGGVFYAAEHIGTVLHAWRQWTADLPEATTTSVAILRLPPAPELPEALRGRTVAHLRFCHVGPAAEGSAVLGPMRAAAPVLMDTVTELPYAAVDAIHQDPDHPVPVCSRGLTLRELTAETVDSLLAVAGLDLPSPLIVCELRLLGGALRRGPLGGNAVGSREAAYSLTAIGIVAPDTAEIAPAAVDAVMAGVQPWSSGQSLLNLHGTPGDDADRALAWEPDIYRRLAALTLRLDPHGLFRHGHAIARANSV